MANHTFNTVVYEIVFEITTEMESKPIMKNNYIHGYK